MLIEISHSTCKQFNNFVSFEVKMHEFCFCSRRIEQKKMILMDSNMATNTRKHSYMRTQVPECCAMIVTIKDMTFKTVI